MFIGDGSLLTNLPGGTSSGSSGTTYYLNYSVAGVPYGINNNALQVSLTNSSQNTDLNVSIPYNSGNGTLIRRFYTSTSIPSFIPGGIWDLNLFVSTDSYYIRVFYKILKLASDGITITQIGTNSVSSDIYPTNNTISQITLSIEIPYTVLNAGDIVYIEIYASNSDTSGSHTLTVYYEDSTYSHLHTTFLQSVTTSISSLNISTGSLFASFVSSQQVTASSIRATMFIGDGSMLTNITGTGGGLGTTDLTSSLVGLGTLNYLSSFNKISSLNISTGSLFASFVSSQQVTASSIRATMFIGDGSLLTNLPGGTGVTYITAGEGISIDANTGSVTITATGITTGTIVDVNLTSTIFGLAKFGYLSSFTTISSLNISSGSLFASFISSQQVSASSITANKFIGDGSMLTNITGTGGGLGTIDLTSSLVGLGTLNYLSSFATISSLNISSGSLFASFVSSQQLTASSITATIFIGDGSMLANILATTDLTSTVTGLGSIGYLSSSAELISSPQLTSSLIGLGSIGYLSSSAELISSPQLTSSLVGLGSMLYISSFDTLSSLNISSGSIYTSTTSTTETNAGRLNFGTLYNNGVQLVDQYGNILFSFQTL